MQPLITSGNKTRLHRNSGFMRWIEFHYVESCLDGHARSFFFMNGRVVFVDFDKRGFWGGAKGQIKKIKKTFRLSVRLLLTSRLVCARPWQFFAWMDVDVSILTALKWKHPWQKMPFFIKSRQAKFNVCSLPKKKLLFQKYSVQSFRQSSCFWLNSVF